MYRVGKLKYWRRKKKPREGQSFAKSGYCLTNHFHRSGLEVRVCDELRLRKIAKDIKDYRVEVTFPLKLEGVNLGSYRADFVVEENSGDIEILEAKGIFFQKFKRDWKILQAMNKDNPAIKFRIVTQ